MIGKRLALERNRLKFTQAEFSKLTGTGRSKLAMLETGKAPLRLQLLIDFEAKTGVDPIFVLTGKPARVLAGELFDWDLALQINAHVRAWCDANAVTLSPEKQTLSLKLLYERISVSREDIRLCIDQLLPITKG